MTPLLCSGTRSSRRLALSHARRRRTILPIIDFEGNTTFTLASYRDLRGGGVLIGLDGGQRRTAGEEGRTGAEGTGNVDSVEG